MAIRPLSAQEIATRLKQKVAEAAAKAKAEAEAKKKKTTTTTKTTAPTTPFQEIFYPTITETVKKIEETKATAPTPTPTPTPTFKPLSAPEIAERLKAEIREARDEARLGAPTLPVTSITTKPIIIRELPPTPLETALRARGAEEVAGRLYETRERFRIGRKPVTPKEIPPVSTTPVTDTTEETAKRIAKKYESRGYFAEVVPIGGGKYKVQVTTNKFLVPKGEYITATVKQEDNLRKSSEDAHRLYDSIDPNERYNVRLASGAVIENLSGTDYRKMIKDDMNKLDNAYAQSQHLTKTLFANSQKWHPETKVIKKINDKGEVEYEVQFPYAGAEFYTDYVKQLDLPTAIATAFTAQDPFGITSAYYALTGDKQAYLDTKVKALHQTKELTKKGVAGFPEFWISMPITQTVLAYGAGAAMGAGMGYLGAIAPKVATGVKVGMIPVGAVMVAPTAGELYGMAERGEWGELLGAGATLAAGGYAGLKGFKLGYAKGTTAGYRKLSKTWMKYKENQKMYDDLWDAIDKSQQEKWRPGVKPKEVVHLSELNASALEDKPEVAEALTKWILKNQGKYKVQIGGSGAMSLQLKEGPTPHDIDITILRKTFPRPVIYKAYRPKRTFFKKPTYDIPEEKVVPAWRKMTKKYLVSDKSDWSGKTKNLEFHHTDYLTNKGYTLTKSEHARFHKLADIVKKGGVLKGEDARFYNRYNPVNEMTLQTRKAGVLDFIMKHPELADKFPEVKTPTMVKVTKLGWTRDITAKVKKQIAKDLGFKDEKELKEFLDVHVRGKPGEYVQPGLTFKPSIKAGKFKFMDIVEQAGRKGTSWQDIQHAGRGKDIGDFLLIRKEQLLGAKARGIDITKEWAQLQRLLQWAPTIERGAPLEPSTILATPGAKSVGTPAVKTRFEKFLWKRTTPPQYQMPPPYSPELITPYKPIKPKMKLPSWWEKYFGAGYTPKGAKYEYTFKPTGIGGKPEYWRIPALEPTPTTPTIGLHGYPEYAKPPIVPTVTTPAIITTAYPEVPTIKGYPSIAWKPKTTPAITTVEGEYPTSIKYPKVPSIRYPYTPPAKYPYVKPAKYPYKTEPKYPYKPEPKYPYKTEPKYPYKPTPRYPYQPYPSYSYKPSPYKGYPYPTGYPYPRTAPIKKLITRMKPKEEKVGEPITKKTEKTWSPAYKEREWTVPDIWKVVEKRKGRLAMRAEHTPVTKKPEFFSLTGKPPEVA